MKTTSLINSMLINALSLIALVAQWRPVHGKGGGSKGAAAGGGLNVNADDFVGGHYTQEEMNVALAFLAVIMIMFFAVCACQCYQKVKWECAEKWPPIDPAGIQKRPMPCAPYNRDGQV